MLTCQYHIVGLRCDDVSKVKVNFFLELNLQTTPPPILFFLLQILILNLELYIFNLQTPPLRFWNNFFSEKVLEWSSFETSLPCSGQVPDKNGKSILVASLNQRAKAEHLSWFTPTHQPPTTLSHLVTTAF